VIIQSFKLGEVTPAQCNQLGMELAEKIAPHHQVAVYTHTDTDHIHNHIVINSVDLETGKKFNNNNFTKFELQEMTHLKSTYAKNMFRILKQFKHSGYLKIGIDDFKTRLGIPNSYQMNDITKTYY